MSEKRVKIMNKVKGTVILTDPNVPITREWTKKGQIATIPMDVMQDLIYQEGTLELFRQGVLYIVDKEDRIELGLEVEGQKPEIEFLTENQMLGALIGTPKDIENMIKKLPKAQVDEFVDLAVEKEITDMAKVDVIEKLTGKNIIKLVQFNRQLKEDDKETEG